MNDFINAMLREQSITQTENGMSCVDTTGSKTLDLFSILGAIRGRELRDTVSMFSKAYLENKELSTKMMFYGRDIRGGKI